MKKLVFISLIAAFICTANVVNANEQMQTITIQPGSSIVIQPGVTTKVIAEGDQMLRCRIELKQTINDRTQSYLNIFVGDTLARSTGNYSTNSDALYRSAFEIIKEFRTNGLCI